MGAPEATGNSAPAVSDVTTEPKNTPATGDTNPQPGKEPTTPKATPAPAPAPDAKGSKSEPASGGDDDPEAHPDDEGLIKMPLAAFQRRMKHATNAELKELFGTSNRAEILEMKKELDASRAEKEENRKKNLAEIDRIKEDHAKEKARADAAEAKAAAMEEERLAESEDVRIRAIAVEHIKPRYYRVAANDLREHIIEEFKDDFSKVTPKYIAKWFKTYAEENPEIAVQAETETPEPETKTTPAKEKATITNGPNGNRPTPPGSGGNVGGKDPRPGRPNSMSPAEWNAYKRQQGWNF